MDKSCFARRRSSKVSQAAVGTSPLVLSLALLSLMIGGSNSAQALDWPEISFSPPISGFNFPVHITHASDGSGRLFVAELGGRVRIVRDGVVLDTPFLDISDRVGCQQGLLSVAFPPDYTKSGYVYVNYTDKNSCNLVISRFSRSSTDAADADSEKVLLSIPKPPEYAGPAIFHSGGELAFGRDGYLYVGIGDGDNGQNPGDSLNLAQDLGSLRGKILRLDAEPRGQSFYQIPPSNPFVKLAGARPEIWASGVRNPWRSSFDRETGEFYIADVGQATFEEINVQPANSAGGINYGWKIMEGLECGCDQTDLTGLTLPVGGYLNTRPTDCSITGGRVYRGAIYPRMRGVYFYGDFCSGRIWGLRKNGSWESALLRDPAVSGPPISSEGLVSFGEDEVGNVYVTDARLGAIYMISDSVTNAAPVATNDAASTARNTSIVIRVLENDSDADGNTLTVASVTQPTRGSASVTGDRNAVQFVPSRNSSGTFSFKYTISDGQGASSTATVSVTVASSGGR